MAIEKRICDNCGFGYKEVSCTECHKTMKMLKDKFGDWVFPPGWVRPIGTFEYKQFIANGDFEIIPLLTEVSNLTFCGEECLREYLKRIW